MWSIITREGFSARYDIYLLNYCKGGFAKCYEVRQVINGGPAERVVALKVVPKANIERAKAKEKVGFDVITSL